MRRDRAPQASYLQKHKAESKPTSTNNNAVKTDSSSRKPNSNNGKTSGNNGGGGMIAKFIDLDDIPDGLPLSPSQQNNQPASTFPRNTGKQFYAPRQEEDEEEEDEDEDDNVNHYTASRSSPVRSMAAYPSRPPPLPHEEQHTARSNSTNAYPILAAADSGGKKPLPMVYPTTHNSPVKLSARQQDIDWDDDDDDDDDRFDDGFGNVGGCSRLTTPSTSRSRQQKETAVVVERRIPMAAPNKQQHQPPPKNVIKTDHKSERPTQQQQHGNDKHQEHSSSYNKPAVVHSSFGTTGGPPKLPYEITSHNTAAAEDKVELSEKDQLYFSKQPRAVDYRPYTLGQYKQIKPKEYMEIDAHLKPDLNNDVLLAKRANYERVKEFSKQLKDFNRSSLQEQRKLPYSSEVVGIEMTKKRLESNRERALQFSKHVPKPKTKGDTEGGETGNGGVRKTNDYHDDDDDYDNDGYDDSYVKAANDQYGPSYESAMRLQVLQAKHNDNRRNIQAIKKSVGI